MLGVVRRRGLSESHLLEEQMRRVATREVRELVDLHRLHVALQRQQRERQRISDEARAAPGRVHRRPTRTRRRRGRVARAVAVEPSTGVEELAARRDDVLPGLEQCDHIRDIERARHVQHAVRVQGDRGFAIGRREDAGRWFVAERPGVDTVLRRVVDEHAHEVEVGMPDHFPQGATTDVAGGPLDHAPLLVHAPPRVNVRPAAGRRSRTTLR